MHTDIKLALDPARQLEIQLPAAERCREALERAEALGYEARLAAVLHALEQMADVVHARRRSSLAYRPLQSGRYPRSAATPAICPPVSRPTRLVVLS
jgi:hypothetical protein